MTTDAITVQQSTLNKLGIDNDTYLTLKSSIFPGASDASIAMAISYCKAANLDIMQKPVHIVRMNVKNEHNKYEYRDVIMPGITLYRIQASRSGQCAGIDEPEFGPTITKKIGAVDVSYPEWCKVTVKRIVSGVVCEFSAKEFWIENYATRSKDDSSPNMMWTKRPCGQLAKCSESQAWRKAFPELFGGIYTAEEMEGKNTTLDDKNVLSFQRPNPSTQEKCISEDQLIYLTDKISEAKLQEIDILNYLKIGCLEEMKAVDFSKIDHKLNLTIEKQQSNSLYMKEASNG